MVNLFSVGAANGILLSQSILLKPEQSLLIFSHRMDTASQKCACICQNYKQLAAVDKGHICCECENRISGQAMLFSSVSIRDVLLMLQHNTCVCVCVCARVHMYICTPSLGTRACRPRSDPKLFDKSRPRRAAASGYLPQRAGGRARGRTPLSAPYRNYTGVAPIRSEPAWWGGCLPVRRVTVLQEVPPILQPGLAAG